MLNLVLLNLLIAMMASTFAHVREKESRRQLQDTYCLVQEASYLSLSTPAPFNVLVLLYEVGMFILCYPEVQKQYPDCRLGRQIEIFLRSKKLSTDSALSCLKASASAAEAYDTHGFDLAVSACMERARSTLLDQMSSRPAKVSMSQIQEDGD